MIARKEKITIEQELFFQIITNQLPIISCFDFKKEVDFKTVVSLFGVNKHSSTTTLALTLRPFSNSFTFWKSKFPLYYPDHASFYDLLKKNKRTRGCGKERGGYYFLFNDITKAIINDQSFLLVLCASTSSKRDLQNAFELALKLGKIEIAYTFLNKFNNSHKKIIRIDVNRINDNTTPLYWALEYYCKLILTPPSTPRHKQLNQCIDFIKRLFIQGADIGITLNCYGEEAKKEKEAILLGILEAHLPHLVPAKQCCNTL